VRQILQLAAAGATQKFALFSDPRLESNVYHGNIAFIGDSTHLMLGNFGADAGFALEDVYALSKSLDWAHSGRRPLAEALGIFTSIRSPHYQRLYRTVDKFTAIKANLQTEGLDFDRDIEERVKRISMASETWMYYYEIDKAVDQALVDADDRIYHHHLAQEPKDQVDGSAAERYGSAGVADE
jgi:salicylate hydroxylase